MFTCRFLSGRSSLVLAALSASSSSLRPRSATAAGALGPHRYRRASGPGHRPDPGRRGHPVRPANPPIRWPRRDESAAVEEDSTEAPAKPTGDLTEPGRRSCAAPMPGSRELECLAVGDLFRIQERTARRPAGRRPSDRQPRQFSGRFPSSYCGVLFQRSQFSFVRGRSLCRRSPRSSRQWQTAVAIAKIVDQALA